MLLDLSVHLHYRMDQPTDLLLQVEAAALPRQQLEAAHINVNGTSHFARVEAEDAVGDRIWLNVDGDMLCKYSARIDVSRPAPDITQLDATPPHQLPADTVRYLMPSRYCPTDEFQNFATDRFGDLEGGAKVMAIRDWIEEKFQYVPGASNSTTTAIDTFSSRQGVCRDFAHVLISLARASAIPARYASVYSPDVTPQDFHAVAEVYLAGDWHLVDPTGMAHADSTACIGVGQDAADVAFLTSYGNINFVAQSVSVERVTA